MCVPPRRRRKIQVGIETKFDVPPGRWMGGIVEGGRPTQLMIFSFFPTQRENSLTDMFIKVGTF
jgi:hypothetical protein